MIRKAVIVAAGYGTRFLPATKAIPKEMLPVVDKPVIQYIVEDVVSAGIKDIVMVTSSQKRALEDHFDHTYELESQLAQNGKQDLLQEVSEIAELANFIYVRQKGEKGAKGTLVAIQCGYEAIGDEPFFVMWGDDFFVTDPPRCQQLAAAYEKYQAPILGCFDAKEPEHGLHYGFAEGKEVEPGIIKVDKMVEKPGHGKAASTYASVSGFVFTPKLMSYAPQVKPYPNGEYGYTELVQAMIDDGQAVYAAKIKGGAFYNCGNKIDYVKATIELALQRPDMGSELKDYLKTLNV